MGLKQLLLYVIIKVKPDKLMTGGADCEAGYDAIDGLCVKFFQSENRSFNESRRLCAIDGGAGLGDLVMPKTADLINTLRSKLPSDRDYKAWVGVIQTKTSDMWYVDGRKLPDGLLNSDFNNIACDPPRGVALTNVYPRFLCDNEKLPLFCAYPRSTCINGFIEHREATGSACFKVFNTSSTLIEAERNCSNLKAELPGEDVLTPRKTFVRRLISNVTSGPVWFGKKLKTDSSSCFWMVNEGHYEETNNCDDKKGFVCYFWKPDESSLKNVSSTSNVTSPSVSPTSNLTSPNVSPTSNLTSPSVSPTSNLTSPNVSPTSNLTSPNVSPTSNLTSPSVSPTSNLTSSLTDSSFQCTDSTPGAITRHCFMILSPSNNLQSAVEQCKNNSAEVANYMNMLEHKLFLWSLIIKYNIQAPYVLRHNASCLVWLNNTTPINESCQTHGNYVCYRETSTTEKSTTSGNVIDKLTSQSSSNGSSTPRNVGDNFLNDQTSTPPGSVKNKLTTQANSSSSSSENEEKKPINGSNSKRNKSKSVSLQDAYCLATPQKGTKIEDETNELQDGTLIDLCGATLLYASSDGLNNSPTRKHLEEMIDELNAGRPQCPVGLNTLVIPRKSTISYNEKQPYVYLICGHVQGLHDWGQDKNSDGRTCPMCLKVGPIVKLCMGIEPAFYVDSGPPTFAFNPCGHMASEQTVKYWASVPIPHGTNGFQATCPFCNPPSSVTRLCQTHFQDHVD
ncbi:uncharacterized protein LOC143243660 [Tachypleus tridentatus]|uniref:uncharacterized protein LOC143243660 n=1 Tax=Tachypleus tridentatus TaxID=6853 RepID=UPI003FD4A38B